MVTRTSTHRPAPPARPTEAETAPTPASPPPVTTEPTPTPPGQHVEADLRSGPTMTTDAARRASLTPEARAARATAERAALQRLQTTLAEAPQRDALGVPSDAERVMQPGQPMDRQRVLSRLTQFDRDPTTRSDPERCGATVAMGAAIMHGGERGVLDLAGAVRRRQDQLPPAERLSGAQLEELGRIEQRVTERTATYGDLGRLGDLVHRSYATPGPGGERSMDGHNLRQLLRDAGVNPPVDPRARDFVWPALIESRPGGPADHWVLNGRSDNEPFIYDPWPPSRRASLQFAPGEAFQSYARGGRMQLLQP